MTTRSDPAGGQRRPGGMRALSHTLNRIAAKSFRRHGFAVQDIVHDWRVIVGATLAEISIPVQVQRPRGRGSPGAVLHVRVDQAGALELQHIAPIVIERVNTYYGYKAVARLQIVQGPVQGLVRPSVQPIRHLSEQEERQLADLLLDIDDPRLRTALTSLGRRILADNPEESQENC